MDDGKGFIVIWLEKIFGRSWHTSLLACVAAIPQVINGIEAAGINVGIPSATLNSISAIAVVFGLFLAKSQSVSGANRTESTGVPGKVDTGKDPLCEGKGEVK